MLGTEEVKDGVCKSGVPRKDFHRVSTKGLDRVEGLNCEKLAIVVRSRKCVGGESGYAHVDNDRFGFGKRCEAGAGLRADQLLLSNDRFPRRFKLLITLGRK